MSDYNREYECRNELIAINDRLKELVNEVGAINENTQQPSALSFRDQCAIAAMSRICSDYTPSGYPDMATISFEMADAMEQERQKRSGK